MSITPRILEHGDLYLTVAFSPDGSYLAVASRGLIHGRSDGRGPMQLIHTSGKMVLWDTEDWAVQARWSDDLFQSIVWHPKMPILASASRKGVTLWDAKTGKALKTFFEVDSVGWSEEYSGLTFSTDARILAICKNRNQETCILLVDCESESVVRNLTKEEDAREVPWTKFLTGGKHLVGLSYEYDHTDKAYVWDTLDGRLLTTFNCRDVPDNLANDDGNGEADLYGDNLYLSQSGRYLATKGSGQVWELESTPEPQWFLRQTCSSPEHQVWDAIFSSDEHFLVTMCIEGLSDVNDKNWIYSVRLWSIASGRELGVFTTSGRFSAIGISPDSHTLATMSDKFGIDGTVNDKEYTLTLWDISAASRSDWGAHDQPSKWQFHRPETEWPYRNETLVFSPDSQWLAVRHKTHVEIWDVEQIRAS